MQPRQMEYINRMRACGVGTRASANAQHVHSTPANWIMSIDATSMLTLACDPRQRVATTGAPLERRPQTEPPARAER
eukprot:5278437-Alexandrium_andersonii.AAC.1